MFAYVVNSGMSLPIVHVVTQHQQEVLTLKTEVVDQTELVADAVCAISNLATVQVR